ncbi:hypothetical protein MPSEU_000137000 [Mayamaea pseudoterrestris]|nr:hypothetical protein MPSEU_000137000 [Mayamaea pseudoterrestris]
MEPIHSFLKKGHQSTMPRSNGGAGRRQKYNSGGSNKNKKTYSNHNPARGGPGVLWTCEPGKERRCLREGLDILQHYLADDVAMKKPEVDDDFKQKQQTDASNEQGKEGEPKLTLDDEIAMLKNRNKSKNGKSLSDLPFQEYETGCKGTVFMLYTGSTRADAVIAEQDCTSSDQPQAKKARLEETDSVAAAVTATTTKCASDGDEASDPQSQEKVALPISPDESTWQVLPTVLTIFEDQIKDAALAATAAVQDDDDNKISDQGSKGSALGSQPVSSSSHIPTSRFMTRMIPIQATCFAKAQEVQDTFALLLEQHVSAQDSKHTFAISTKRRCCEHLKSQEVIQAIGGQVAKLRPNWTVNLRQPDFTVIVETCKTLVGISILPSSYLSVVRNFNLAELRTNIGVATE